MRLQPKIAQFQCNPPCIQICLWESLICFLKKKPEQNRYMPMIRVPSRLIGTTIFAGWHVCNITSYSHHSAKCKPTAISWQSTGSSVSQLNQAVVSKWVRWQCQSLSCSWAPDLEREWVSFISSCHKRFTTLRKSTRFLSTSGIASMNQFHHGLSVITHITRRLSNFQSLEQDRSVTYANSHSMGY